MSHRSRKQINEYSSRNLRRLVNSESLRAEQLLQIGHDEITKLRNEVSL